MIKPNLQNVLGLEKKSHLTQVNAEWIKKKSYTCEKT